MPEAKFARGYRTHKAGRSTHSVFTAAVISNYTCEESSKVRANLAQGQPRR